MAVREDVTQIMVGAGKASSPDAIDLKDASSVLIVGYTNLADSHGIQVSSDGTNYADVSSSDLIVAAGGNAAAYIGYARYMKITTASNHDVYAVLAYQRHCPTPES